MGAVLGVDWGEKRIGVAVTDPLRITVRGLTVIPADGKELSELARLASEHQVDRLVVGMPVHDDGRPSKSAAKIEAFVERLKATVALPVDTWDESNASWEANRILKERGRSWRDSKKEIDRVAAAVMLQSWLDGQAEKRQEETPE